MNNEELARRLVKMAKRVAGASFAVIKSKLKEILSADQTAINRRKMLFRLVDQFSSDKDAILTAMEMMLRVSKENADILENEIRRRERMK